jgi:hypothetical protein
MAKTYYKTVGRDLKSWHGDIQYIVGKEISLPAVKEPQLCTDTVLHASEKPLDALKYAATLDCGLLEVSGDEVVHGDDKSGFFSLSVIREVPDTEKDSLYGFLYNEAVHSINPCEITSKLTEKDKENLKQWASLSDTAWDSFNTSIWYSVGSSLGDSVWDSVLGSAWDSYWDSVWESISVSTNDSIKRSVKESIWAYIGSWFPGIDKWEHFEHKKGEYPFRSGVELWKRGFIPVKTSGKWKLYHPMRDKRAKLVWEI